MCQVCFRAYNDGALAGRITFCDGYYWNFVSTWFDISAYRHPRESYGFSLPVYLPGTPWHFRIRVGK
jgi:hypothetical protein